MGDLNRLSAMDTALVFTEQPPVNMNIGALLIFERLDATPDEVAAHIESRLHRLPRFRQRLLQPALGLGRPVWVDDEHFDINFHVRSVGLGGTRDEAALLDLFGRLQSIPLDRSRPLWELWLVDLPDGRHAVIQKIHHAMVDGVSDTDILVALLDLARDATAEPAPDWQPAPPPSQAELLVDSGTEAMRRSAATLKGLADAARRPGDIAEGTAGVARALAATLGAVTEPAPATSLNTTIGSRRRFEVVRVALDTVKAAKNRHGTTVNDVILAAAACGLRHLLRSRGEDVEGLRLKATVPMSVRPDSEHDTLGNQFTPLLVDLPLDTPDPAECLADVHAQMEAVKTSPALAGGDTLVHATELLPTSIIAVGVRAVIAHQHVMNLMVTNIPGPQFPVYFMGAELLELFPYVSLIQHTSVGIAIASYNGELNFGLSGDWDSTADLAILAEGIAKSVADL